MHIFAALLHIFSIPFPPLSLISLLLSGKLSPVRVDKINHTVYFDFSETISSTYYSPSSSLEKLVRSSSINILSQISRLIFPENIDQDLPLASALQPVGNCYHP